MEWDQVTASHELVSAPAILEIIVQLFLISYFNIQKLFVGIVWIVDNIDSLFVRESSVEVQDLYSSTWYTACIVSARLRQLHSILSL